MGGRARWRPGPDTAIALVALILAGGGVSWAVSQDSGMVISACALTNNGNTLVLSTNGSCSAGQQLVQWNQQGVQGATGPTGQPGLIGSQGPPGQNGATTAPPSFAMIHRSFAYRFAIDMDFTATGTYDVEGTVTEAVNTAFWPQELDRYKGLGLTCFLFAGATGFGRVDVETQQFTFYGSPINLFYPTLLNGPYGAGGTVKVPVLPYHARFQCEGTQTSGNRFRVVLLPVRWIDPMINAEIAHIQNVAPSKLVVVGPVLHIGPGPGPVQTH